MTKGTSTSGSSSIFVGMIPSFATAFDRLRAKENNLYMQKTPANRTVDYSRAAASYSHSHQETLPFKPLYAQPAKDGDMKYDSRQYQVGNRTSYTRDYSKAA